MKTLTPLQRVVLAQTRIDSLSIDKKIHAFNYMVGRIHEMIEQGIEQTPENLALCVEKTVTFAENL
jgi:hypothetical protein